MNKERNVYLVEVEYQSEGSEQQLPSEQFYAFAGSPSEAIAWVERDSGGLHGKIIRSLSCKESNAFKFLDSARLVKES